MQEENEHAVDRRRLLRRAGTVAAGVAGAGVVTAMAASPAEAAPGGNVVLGAANDAGTTLTGVTTSSVTNAAVALTNSATATQDGVVVAGPSLRLVPAAAAAQSVSTTAPVGSVALTGDGTIWYVSGADSDGSPLLDFVHTTGNGNITVPLGAPQRVIDTRNAAQRANIINASGNLDSSGRLIGGKTIIVNLDSFVFFGEGLLGNATAVSTTAPGFLTVYPYFPGGARPGTSNVNYQGNSTLSNALAAGIGWDPDNGFTDLIAIFANATTHVIFDVAAFVVSSRGQINPDLLSASGSSDVKALQAQQLSRREAQQKAKPSWEK